MTPAEIFNKKKRRADIAGELMFQKSRLGGRLIVAVNVMKIPDWPVSTPRDSDRPYKSDFTKLKWIQFSRTWPRSRNPRCKNAPRTRQTETRRKEIGKRLSGLRRMMKRIK